MSFDRDSLGAALAAHDRVARVVIADIAGSTPREVGAAMLVWPGGQSGTIGGGTLEFDAAASARSALRAGRDHLDRLSLGPSLGQCCGGAVTVLTEIWDTDRLSQVTTDVVARPMPDGPREMPMAVRRLLKVARGEGDPVPPGLLGGWMVEPVTQPTREVWIFGAGHVGRAIVGVLADLPEIAIRWIDTSDDRFPGSIPDRVTKLIAASPADVVRYATPHAEHFVLTYSHTLDLDLCHALLQHNFRFAGLIGSKTKLARFRSRLRQLGHSEAQISRITCPIGDPALGKHPQAIAVGVAAALLTSTGTRAAAKDATG